MPHEIKISHGSGLYETASFAFAGGEIQVAVPGLSETLDGDISVLARLQSPAAIMRLLLTADILARHHRTGRKRLVVPYFPYARQDRVMRSGEAFSLKAVARLVNGLGFDEVTTCDPHSDVTPALVENLRVTAQADLVTAHDGIGRIIHSDVTVVAPDAGAAKKAFAVASYYRLPLVTASKARDVATGAITRTEVHDNGSLAGRTALIVDDICDGGRTFVELAKALRAHGAASVHLYVTHGIFSQGLGVFDGLVDAVYTTDTFLSRDVEAPHQSPVPLHVSPLNL